MVERFIYAEKVVCSSRISPKKEKEVKGGKEENEVNGGEREKRKREKEGKERKGKERKG